MAEIMIFLHQYIPAKQYVEAVDVEGADRPITVHCAVLHPLLFGGDQLTASRARGSRQIMMNGISPKSHLEGLIPCAEDWHAKVNLLEVAKIYICMYAWSSVCQYYS